MVVSSDQIVFMTGKEKGLQRLFSQDNFGYLAIGYSDDPAFTNDDNNNGFNEIKLADEPTYTRVPLQLQGETVRDDDTGKVSVKFTADLDIDNISYGSPINQLAIVDSSDSTDPNTVYYAASVFPKFTKNSDIAITFLIEMKI